MHKPMRSSPENVIAIGDPGDETASRYRFQWTYAAIVCCMLLDESEDITEVFCEHHEDVLIKHADGSYSGLQVKTRGSDQGLWKANDDAVKTSCARFSKIESTFPSVFRKFHFLTNHPLYVSKNGNDLRNILKTIQEADSSKTLTGPALTFLNGVAREAGVRTEIAFTALSKTTADDSLPKLPDAEIRLMNQLTGVWSQAAESSIRLVRQAAKSLIMMCTEASSLAHRDILSSYLSLSTDPEQAEISARLSGKRINRTRLLEILNQGLSDIALLESSPGSLAELNAGTQDLLFKKLDAGGFSAVSLNSAANLRDKAEYLGLVWTQKHGRDPGLKHYGHVQSLVLRDAARAFETTKNTQYFGQKMLNELHSRFQETRASGSPLYDCSDEHLEGFAYSLTAQCKVQWSLDRPWEKE